MWVRFEPSSVLNRLFHPIIFSILDLFLEKNIFIAFLSPKLDLEPGQGGSGSNSGNFNSPSATIVATEDVSPFSPGGNNSSVTISNSTNPTTTNASTPTTTSTNSNDGSGNRNNINTNGNPTSVPEALNRLDRVSRNKILFHLVVFIYNEGNPNLEN